MPAMLASRTGRRTRRTQPARGRTGPYAPNGDFMAACGAMNSEGLDLEGTDTPAPSSEGTGQPAPAPPSVPPPRPSAWRARLIALGVAVVVVAAMVVAVVAVMAPSRIVAGAAK